MGGIWNHKFVSSSRTLINAPTRPPLPRMLETLYQPISSHNAEIYFFLFNSNNYTIYPSDMDNKYIRQRYMNLENVRS
jgi:hypothetical protein